VEWLKQKGRQKKGKGKMRREEKKDKLWVSQIISADTRKLLVEICKVTRRSVPTELEILVEEYYNKVKK